MPQEKTKSDVITQCIGKMQGNLEGDSDMSGKPKALENPDSVYVIGTGVNTYSMQRLVGALLGNNTLVHVSNMPGTLEDLQIDFVLSGQRLRLRYSTITGVPVLYYSENGIVEQNLLVIKEYIQSLMR